MTLFTTRERIGQVFGAISLQLTLSFLIGFMLFNVAQLRDMVFQTNQNNILLIQFTISVVYFSFVMWWSSRSIINFTYHRKSPPYSGTKSNNQGLLKRIIKNYKDFIFGEYERKINEYPADNLGVQLPRWLPLIMLTILSILAVSYKAFNVAIVSIIVGVILTIIFCKREKWVDAWETEKEKATDTNKEISIVKKVLSTNATWLTLLGSGFVVPTLFAIIDTQWFSAQIAGLALIMLSLANIVLGLVLVTYVVLIEIYNILFSILSKLIKVLFDSLPEVLKPFDMANDFLVLRPPYPITTVVFFTALLISIALPTDNHAFRVLEPNISIQNLGDKSYCECDFGCNEIVNSAKKSFENVEDALSTFVEKEPQLEFEVSESEHKTIPVFIIANQGGGLRAAYWSAVALSYLEQKHPGFSTNVFAMTGASGGTVGNAAFISAIEYFNKEHESIEPVHCEMNGSFAPVCQMKAFLSHDFLSPVVTSMLHNDLLYRFLPLPFLEDDRAFHLETAFSSAFANTFSIDSLDNTPLERGYMAFYREKTSQEADNWTPIMIGASYIQELGGISLTVPFKFDEEEFNRMYDLQALQASHIAEYDDKVSAVSELDLPFITVAINSARFPYVSPNGSLFDKAPYNKKLHTADAGYFDNYGALSALSLLRIANKYFADHNIKEDIRYIPIVLVMKNSPTYQKNGVNISYNLFDHKVSRATMCHDSIITNELLGPLQGLLSSRGGQADRSLIDFRNAYRTMIESKYPEKLTAFHTIGFTIEGIEQCKRNKSEPPVGWWLSKDSRDIMDKSIVEQVEHFLSAIEPLK